MKKLILKFSVAFVWVVFLHRSALARNHSKTSKDETVILIHGLGRTSLSMKRLEWRLERDGFQVINVSYPSRKYCVEQLAEDFLPTHIVKISSSKATKVHFITHSMGGILLREYLSNHSLKKLGRVVMLAPPNQGSELADKLKDNSIGQWILGPAGCELGVSGLPKKLGPVGFELGVIAGDRSLNPFFSCVVPRPNDGKVSISSTKVEGMKDFTIVHSSHTWMPWRSKTIVQALFFLEQGRFNREHS